MATALIFCNSRDLRIAGQIAHGLRDSGYEAKLFPDEQALFGVSVTYTLDEIYKNTDVFVALLSGGLALSDWIVAQETLIQAAHEDDSKLVIPVVLGEPIPSIEQIVGARKFFGFAGHDSEPIVLVLNFQIKRFIRRRAAEEEQQK